jgi:hypothetical protein
LDGFSLELSGTAMSRIAQGWCPALLLMAVSGCTQNASQPTESSNMKPLAVHYGTYINRHGGQPPANEEEFKAYLKTVSPEALKSFNVTDAESLLVSTRDKKPYVIRYGKVTGPAGPGGMPVFAYEQEGVGGKRYIATLVGAVEEVDDARFRELVPDAR